MTRKALIIIAIGALNALAACGTTPQERTTGGTAAGAATGAGIGALAGPPGMAIGALVGGGAGAITGATTSPNQVNLGKPPWTNPDTHMPSPPGPSRAARSSSSNNPSADRLND